MNTEMQELEARIRAAYDGMDLHPTEAGLDRLRQAPVGTTARPAGWKRWAIVATGVAAGLVLVVPIRQWRSGTRVPVVGALAEATLPAEMLAQGAPFPSFPVVTATRDIRPGEMAYAYLGAGDSFTDSTHVMHSRIERASWEGQPAWLMLGNPTQDRNPVWRDSVWFDTTEVRQLARSVSVYKSNARIVEEFREQDVLRGYFTDHGTTWTVITKENDPENGSGGFVLRSDALNLALRRAPIDRDWRGSIAMVVWPYYSKLARQWYDLSVIGEETVTVPGGTFDCWKIQLGPGPARVRGIFFWVTKDKQWIAQWGANDQHDRGFRMVLVQATEE